jgi:hypothetical protein
MANNILGHTRVPKLVANPSNPRDTFQTKELIISIHFGLLILSASRPAIIRHIAYGTRKTGPDKTPYSTYDVPVSDSIELVEAI